MILSPKDMTRQIILIFQIKMSQRLKFIIKNIFNLNQRKKISKILKKFKINLSVEELIDYMKNSFSSREYAKLIFTKNVSQILKSIKKNFI